MAKGNAENPKGKQKSGNNQTNGKSEAKSKDQPGNAGGMTVKRARSKTGELVSEGQPLPNPIS